MAKDLSVLQSQIEAIKTEVNKGANTSERIGGMFGDMLDYNEEKLTELSSQQGKDYLFENLYPLSERINGTKYKELIINCYIDLDYDNSRFYYLSQFNYEQKSVVLYSKKKTNIEQKGEFSFSNAKQITENIYIHTNGNSYVIIDWSKYDSVNFGQFYEIKYEEGVSFNPSIFKNLQISTDDVDLDALEKDVENLKSASKETASNLTKISSSYLFENSYPLSERYQKINYKGLFIDAYFVVEEYDSNKFYYIYPFSETGLSLYSKNKDNTNPLSIFRLGTVEKSGSIWKYSNENGSYVIIDTTNIDFEAISQLGGTTYEEGVAFNPIILSPNNNTKQEIDKLKETVTESVDSITDKSSVINDYGNTLFSGTGSSWETPYIDLSGLSSIYVKCCRYSWNVDAIAFFKKEEEEYTLIEQQAGKSGTSNLVYNEEKFTKEYWNLIQATHVKIKTLNSTFFEGESFKNSKVIEYVETLDLVNFNKKVNETIDVKIADIKDSVEIFLPNEIYAVKNDTLQVFVRSIVKAVNPYNYSIKFTCDEGVQYPRYYEHTPTAKKELQLKIEVRNNVFKVIAEKSITIKVSDIPTSNKELSVLCVGSSTTSPTSWPQELYRRLTASDGTPVGIGLGNISFGGRLKDGDVGCEATGGFSWSSYLTTTQAIRFEVTESNLVSPGEVFKYTSDSGDVYVEVKEVNLTEGVGNITVQYYFDTPNKQVPTEMEGTICGRYDESKYFTYSSFAEEEYSPFIDENGEVNFTNYVNTYCNGKLNIMAIYLTAFNAGKMGEDSMDSEKDNMRIFFNKLFEQYPDCKVVLNTAMLSSQNGGVEKIATAKGSAFTYAATTMYFNYNKAVQEIAEEYQGKIYIADICGQTDSENVLPQTEKEVNVRMTDKKEYVGTNNVHPLINGYMQFADAFYRAFVYIINTFFAP